MKAEAEAKSQELDMAFEQSLFVHDRDLWKAVYEPNEEQIEQEVEWVTRDDPQEFQQMMDELRGMGLLDD